ncbi:MAG: ATP-binding cassette domain-containing protein [Actinobacteria bacterium]|nr:ATP-binding cassette domain-containing protein [Actinomycetota bacterium]
MIEVSNLTKRFGAVLAVDKISFHVPTKTIVGFLGANGAGKTTTLRMLAGLLTPTSGTAKVDGHDCLTDSLAVRRILGYMPEQVALYDEMRVEELLDYTATMRGIARRDRKSAVAWAMDHCQLTNMRRRLAGTLSKGYRQRVGLAQAVVAKPKVVILDEPTIGLDPAQIKETRQMIRGLAENCTVLLSTHILSEVEQIGSRVLIISSGKLLADDSLSNLVKDGQSLEDAYMRIAASEKVV